ncbi:MAG: hypothetical protein R3F61_13730 [Myxococcota bacterium]
MVHLIEQSAFRELLFFSIVFTTAVMASMFTATLQRWTAPRRRSGRDDRT